MAGIAITESELLDALSAACGSTAPEGARTFQEIMAETGLAERRIRNALRTLHAAGRLEVHRVQRTDMAGNVQRPPAYTIRAA